MGQLLLKAFISYRRRDAYIPISNGEPDFAFIRKLESALYKAGFQDVFVDTGDIALAEDYETKIHEAVSDCDLVVAVVGSKWLEILQEKAASRDSDTLLQEIRIGLEQDREIVPLLVDGAKMPREIDLPKPIRLFHDRNGPEIKSIDTEETIATEFTGIAQQIAERRRRAAWWLRTYIILACFAWYACAIQPHIVGLLEFRPKSWGAIAAIWSGFYIWPIFFLPLALVALCRPILAIIESVTNASRPQEKITYLTPLIFGTILAGLAMALEVGGYDTPWSIHPRLPDCAGASASTNLRVLSHYNEPPDAELARKFGDEFWMTEKCWPNVFYYLTVPLYRGAVTQNYLASRTVVAGSFNALLRDGGEPHSWVFYPYLISVFILIWLLGTGVVMSIFYVMVQIRRSTDFSLLRRPSERAYLCLTYTFVTVMIWVPFRINTDYFKYLYSCEDYGNCPGAGLELYLTDVVLAVTLLICYAFLTIGLVVKYRRLALGLLGAFAVALTLVGAFLIYWFRTEIAQISDSWRFSVAISIPVILVMLALGYAFDPSVARFNEARKDN